MNNFTLRLKRETYDNHTILDTHIFVKSLYDENYNKNVEYYLELHYIILNELNVLINKKGRESFPNFFDYFDKEYTIYNGSDLISRKSVRRVLDKINIDSENNELFICHLYIWWLGVLFGGQIIKKLINKNNNTLNELTGLIFDFGCDSRELVREFRKYLNSTILEEDKFIKNVNGIKIIYDHNYIINNLYLKIKTFYETKVNYYYTIHGDPHLSNIINDISNNLFFIDPRGYFGKTKLFGLKEYDSEIIMKTLESIYEKLKDNPDFIEILESHQYYTINNKNHEIILQFLFSFHTLHIFHSCLVYLLSDDTTVMSDEKCREDFMRSKKILIDEIKKK